MIHRLSCALLAFGLAAVGAALGGEKPTAPPGNRPAAAEYSLTKTAQQGRRLVDAGKFGPADEFFRKELSAGPRDAGLLCQYVRFLILSRDPADAGFIRSPLFPTEETCWVLGAANRAATEAVHADPACKKYLANLLLESFADQLGKVLDAGKECIGRGTELFDPGTGRDRRVSGADLSMIRICWRALEFDPDLGPLWAVRYEALTRRCVRAGLAASAMMVGNLTGDLKQKGKGSEDFRTATRAFLEALVYARGNGSRELLQEVADAYPVCFAGELREFLNNPLSDPLFPLFTGLMAELEARGVKFSLPKTSVPAP